MIVSRTYISLHTSNSIACTLRTGLEVQPRLEVCWALDIRTARHSSRQLLANAIRTMRSFVKRKTPLPSFINMGFRLQKIIKLHTKRCRIWQRQKLSPTFITLGNVFRNISFGFSLLLLDTRLGGSFTLQWESRCSLLAGGLARQAPALPSCSPRKTQK